MESLPQNELREKIQLKLKDLSSKQKYQVFLILFMSLTWMTTTFISMMGAFVYMNPLFQCNGEPATEAEACSKRQNSTYYDGLYCDRENLRSTIQSIFFIGVIVGMFALVPLSDLKGRRFATFSSFLIQIFGVGTNFLGIYLNYWVLMMIGQFLIGVSNASLTVISYVITGQFSSQKLRQRSIMIYCAVWGFSEMLFLIFYQFMPQWHIYIFYNIFIPSIMLAIPTYFFFLETPYYWIFLAKDQIQFNKCIKKLHEYNGIEKNKRIEIGKLSREYLSRINIKQAGTQSQSQNKSQVVSLKQKIKMLLVKKYLVILMCISSSYIGLNIYYYSMQGSMERVGYNFGINMLLAGIHEFLGYLSAGYIVDKVPRKKSLIIIIIITSVMGLALMIPFVKSNQILESIIISLARLCTVYAYSFIILLQTQSFPLEIRSTAVGVTQGISRTGIVFVPYLVNVMNDLGIHPLIFSSILYLVIGIVPLGFIKETFVRSDKKTQDQKEEDILNPEGEINTKLIINQDPTQQSQAIDTH